MSKAEKIKKIKIEPDVINLKEHNIKNVSASSIIPLNYADVQPKVKKLKAEQQEKVSFSSRVNQDLIVDYKNAEHPPTERFFDSFSHSREETKHSVMKGYGYSYRKTSREVQNTESTLHEYFKSDNTKANQSYMSDKSININDINRTETSGIFPLNTDSISRCSKKLYTNVLIDQNCSKNWGRNRTKLGSQDPYYDNILVSSITKHKGKDKNLDHVMSIQESKDEQADNSGRSSPYFSTNLKGFKSVKMTDTMMASDQQESLFPKNLSSHLLASERKDDMIIEEESFNIDPVTLINHKFNNINISSINSPSGKGQKQYRLKILTELEKDSKLERIKENVDQKLSTSMNSNQRKDLFLSAELESVALFKK